MEQKRCQFKDTTIDFILNEAVESECVPVKHCRVEYFIEIGYCADTE